MESAWLGAQRAKRGRSPEKIAKALKFTSDTPPKENKKLIVNRNKNQLSLMSVLKSDVTMRAC